jgi:hypothetical protein
MSMSKKKKPAKRRAKPKKAPKKAPKRKSSKSRNPRITKKPAKRRAPTKKQRVTRARKKGWATRRRTQRAAGTYKPSQKQRAATQRAVKIAEARLKKEFAKREREYIKRERELSKAAKLKEKKQVERARRKEQSDLKRLLRGTKKGQKLLEQYIKAGMFIETDETKILERMRAAELVGDSYDEAYRCAEEFDMDVREIYEIFFSP